MAANKCRFSSDWCLLDR